MKWTLLLCLALLAACDDKPKPVATKPKVESAFDVPTPQTSAPPVETRVYEKGFTAGTIDGTAAGTSARAKARKVAVVKPTAEAVDVLALEAAGADPERGPKWQRGYVAGYQEAFERVAEGKK